jgi:hypothetical protein
MQVPLQVPVVLLQTLVQAAPVFCQVPVLSQVCGCCPVHCLFPGVQVPLQVPVVPLQTLGQAVPVFCQAPVVSQVCGCWPLHCLSPGVQAPVQAAVVLLQTLVQTGPVFCHVPVVSQVWGCNPLHCLLPGVQEPLQVPVVLLHTLVQAAPVLCQLPVLSQVCGCSPLHCLLPGVHVPVQSPVALLQTLVQAAPVFCQELVLSQVCGCSPLHCLLPGVHVPAHAPPEHPVAHTAPVFCHLPLESQVCGCAPMHCLEPTEQPTSMGAYRHVDGQVKGDVPRIGILVGQITVGRHDGHRVRPVVGSHGLGAIGKLRRIGAQAAVGDSGLVSRWGCHVTAATVEPGTALGATSVLLPGRNGASKAAWAARIAGTHDFVNVGTAEAAADGQRDKHRGDGADHIPDRPGIGPPHLECSHQYRAGLSG